MPIMKNGDVPMHTNTHYDHDYCTRSHTGARDDMSRAFAYDRDISFFKNVQTVYDFTPLQAHGNLMRSTKRPNHALRNIAYDDISMRRMHALNHMPDDCRTV